MTDKKEKILIAALKLFANEGYNATSTNKIAKEAGVSEGLIFRHFGNKEGLRDAILLDGEEKARIFFADIIFETDPHETIRKCLELSKKVAEDQDVSDFWKLQYKLKWELEVYGEHKMEPLEHALTVAFTKLGYPEPALEARLLLVNLDGIATRYFLQKNFDLDAVINFMQAKYKS